MKLIHKGSTKDVYQAGENYLFHFSDRYSVFDWGEMPDLLRDKGLSLAKFTKSIYHYLQNKKIQTHLLDLPCHNQEMLVRPFKVLREVVNLPKEENLFIPLEVIFRLGVATGSSLLKRSSHYKELDRFSEPMIEFTTKLERFDRPLSHEEAKTLSGMNQGEWTDLLKTTTLIANELETLFQKYGIMLWDGKVEFALGKYQGENREIILVDSIGPDELRLTKDGVQLSKEVIRQFYRRSSWYEELEKVKTAYGINFKDHIAPPQKLPEGLQHSIEEMYRLLPDLINDVSGAEQRLQSVILSLKASL